LSGGPASIYAEGAPRADARVLELGVPVLGICYGLQYIAATLGGEVARAAAREYGPATLHVPSPHALFEDVPESG
jgi:GMP synthase (glutamine-hydrolysing)